MTIKYKQVRATELRRLADLIEKEDSPVIALTLGMTLGMEGLEEPAALTFWAGDEQRAMSLIRMATTRLPEGSPFPEMTDVPEGQGKMVVSKEKNIEPEENVFDFYDAMQDILKMASLLTKMSG